MSILKSHLLALAIIAILMVVAIFVANQPGLFLADVMQGQGLGTTQHTAHLLKDVRGNTIHIVGQVNLKQVMQIDMTIHYDPDLISIGTPISDYELFTNQEAPHRLKIILRPQTPDISAQTSLIRIPYQGNDVLTVSDVSVTQSDDQTLALSIQQS